MLSDDESPTSLQNFLDVVRIDCACVEVLARMILVPLLRVRLDGLVDRELASHDALWGLRESKDTEIKIKAKRTEIFK